MTRVRVPIGLLCGALAFVLARPADAADRQYGGHDWFMSAAASLVVDNADVSGGKPTFGGSLVGGFRFNRWVTAEVGGEWVYRIRYDSGSGPSCSGTGGGSRRFTAWQATAGSRLYLTESLVQPFVAAHGGVIQTRDSGGGRSCQATGFVTRLGGGVDVFVSEAAAVSLLGMYVLPVTGGTRDHDYISIGLGITWY